MVRAKNVSEAAARATKITVFIGAWRHTTLDAVVAGALCRKASSPL
jgi:hypothetical protein